MTLKRFIQARSTWTMPDVRRRAPTVETRLGQAMALSKDQTRSMRRAMGRHRSNTGTSRPGSSGEVFRGTMRNSGVRERYLARRALNDSPKTFNGRRWE